MHFIVFIADFVEGDDILASDVLPLRDLSLSGASNKSSEYMGAKLQFVRINRLGWPLNNGKGFSKISKSTDRDGAYRLQFDFS